jgi:hypothetical protein
MARHAGWPTLHTGSKPQDRTTPSALPLLAETVLRLLSEDMQLLDPNLECITGAVHRYVGKASPGAGRQSHFSIWDALAHADHVPRVCCAKLPAQATINRFGREPR